MALFLLRLFPSLFMALLHGLAKFNKMDILITRFPDPIGLGSAVSLYLVIFAELGCSILLMLGLYTRLATIPLMITMSVAAFIVHINDPISKIELPVIYLTIYVVLFIMGPGKYALKGPVPKKDIPFLNKLLKF